MLFGTQNKNLKVHKTVLVACGITAIGCIGSIVGITAPAYSKVNGDFAYQVTVAAGLLSIVANIMSTTVGLSYKSSEM